MKTLALLVLISATIFGVTAYAHEPSGELDYPPAISHTGPVTRTQAISELQAAKTAGQVTPGETEESATEMVTLEPIRIEARAVDVIGIYSSGDESYKSAFSVVGLPRG